MDEPLINASPDNNEMHPLDYLIVLAKYSRMIVIVSAAVAILTYLYLFFSPNLYTATARLLPPQQNLTLSGQLLDTFGSRVTPGSGGGPAGFLGGAAPGLLGLKSGEMYVAMMNSELVLDHIIDRFHLRKQLKAGYIEDARKKLLKYVKIDPGKKDNIIVVSVTWRDPKLASEMANAFVDELDRLLQNLSVQEAKARMALFEKELDKSSQNLTKAEESMRRFSEQNGVLQIEAQTRGAIQYIANLRAEIDSKEVQTQVMRYQATPGNADMIRMKMEINGLKEKLRDAESQMEGCTGDVCLPAGKTPALGLEYIRLLREVKFQESLYQLYKKLVEVAQLDIARNVAVVQVIAPATLPERKVNKWGLPALVAGLVTFFLMIFVAFGREYLIDLNYREDDLQRLTALKEYLRPWTDMLRKIKSNIFSKRKL